MSNLRNSTKNIQEQQQQIPNYQISGIQHNYTYNGIQNLNFDTSSISQNGYENDKLLNKGINDQQRFVNNYNEFKPNTTIYCLFCFDNLLLI